MKLYETILIATEFSPISDAAFDEALRLAQSSGAALRVIHVYDGPVVPGAPFGGPELYQEAERAARAAIAERLERLVSRARRVGVDAAGVIRDGFVSDEILDAAAGENADLIVMGTHGRHGFSRIVLGSVAARVVAKAPCPVLTVRTAERPALAERPEGRAAASV